MTQNNLFEGDDIYDFDYLTEDRSEPSRPKIRHRDTSEVPNNKVRLPPVLVGRNVAAMNEAKMTKMAERAMTRTVIKAEEQAKDWHKERLKLKGPRQPMKEVRTFDTKVPWNKTRLPQIPEVAEPKPTPRTYEDLAVSRIRPLQDQIQLNMASVKSENDSLLPTIFNDKPQKEAIQRKFPNAAEMDKIDFPSEETPYRDFGTVTHYTDWQHGNGLDKTTAKKPPMPPSAIRPTNGNETYSKRRRKLRYIADADIYNEPAKSRNEKSILAPIPPSDPLKTPMDESIFAKRRPLRVRFAANTELNQDVSVHKESKPFYRPRPNTPYDINSDEEVRMSGNAKSILAPIPPSDPLKIPMDEPTYAERRPLRVRFAANTELNQDVSVHKESKPFYRPRPNTQYDINNDEEVRMSGNAKSILAPIPPSDPMKTPMDESRFAERRPLRVRFAANSELNQDVSVHKESKPFYRPRPNTPYEIDYDEEVRKAAELARELEKEREVHRARELEKEREVHRARELEKEREVHRARELEKERDAHRTRVLEKEREVHRARELEKEREVHRARELEKEREVHRARELEKEREVHRARELEKEREVHRARELEKEREVHRARELEKERDAHRTRVLEKEREVHRARELEKEREVQRAREFEKERDAHRQRRREEVAAREEVRRAKVVDEELEKKKEEPRRISREEAIARYGVEHIEDLMYGVKYPEAPPLPHPANIGKASLRGYPSDSAISAQNNLRPHEVSWSGEHGRRGAGFVSKVKQQNQPKSNNVTNTQIPEKIRKQMRRYFH